MSERHEITAGFMPLLDSSLLVVAKEKGFAAEEAVDLVLVRESSWANIRDRLAVGHFQVAHMLAPMPIACNLELTPLASPTIAPMALGLGGNAVTVSTALWAEMESHGAVADLDLRTTGRALKAFVDDRSGKGHSPLRFAVVHPHSGHNYELRYWLAACGIDPDRDIEIIIVPPPLMADALRSGSIDGYCVGEPWNTAAAINGGGHIATVKAAIWRSSPEKVLGVEKQWAEANQEALAALLRALYRAARWCGDATNHEELANLLAGPSYIGRPADWMLPALSGQIHSGGGETALNGIRLSALNGTPLSHQGWAGRDFWLRQRQPHLFGRLLGRGDRGFFCIVWNVMRRQSRQACFGGQLTVIQDRIADRRVGSPGRHHFGVGWHAFATYPYRFAVRFRGDIGGGGISCGISAMNDDCWIGIPRGNRFGGGRRDARTV